MRGRKQRSIVLVTLCCLLVFMGIGFAAARSVLNIDGTATAINTWDVRMATVREISKSDGVTNNEENTKISDDGVTATLYADFIKPGDYITYEILVENKGSIDATLQSIVSNLSSDNASDKELFDIQSTLVANTKLEAGKSTTFEVTIKYKEEANKLPTGEVSFNIQLNYLQGDGEGGNTPEGGETQDPENDWLYEVDESGTITAYNYNSTLTEAPQNVVVPAEVNGIAVTTITEESFTPRGNFDAYMDSSAGKIYAIVREDNTTIVDTVNNRTAAEVVVEKALVALTYEECQGDASCIGNYKSIVYLCSDTSTCYQYTDETKAIVSMPESVELMASVYVNPDPSVDALESISEPVAQVSTLDLSNATNLIMIEDSALSSSGLKSVNFGENSSITTIGSNAFSGNDLTEVTIPASVEEIGSRAFSNNEIETLVLETESGVENQLTKNKKYSLNRLGTLQKTTTTTIKGVKEIGEYAFSYNKIQNLVIPSTLETIEQQAFDSNQISKLYLPKTVTSIGGAAFQNNPIEELTIEQCTTSSCSSNSFGTSLKTLTIESGEIGEYAFYGQYSTTKIENLTLGEGVTTIGNSAFEGNQITSLIIPSSLTTIGNSAFYSNQISRLYFPKTVTSLGGNAFAGNPIEILTIEKCTQNSCSYNPFGNSLKTLTIESGEVGDSAFNNNSNLTTLKLREGVTSIGRSAFSYNAITSIILPSTLTEIGGGAFYSNQISELYFPKTVTSLDSGAFLDNSFQTLTIEECNTTICSGYSMSGNSYFGNQIKTLAIESGEIGDYAFQSNEISTTKIESLTLGEGVTTIGTSTFENNAITNLIIPSTLTTIGSSAFSSNQISELYFPKTVTSLGENAFLGNSFESLTIEECNTTVCAGNTLYGNPYFGSEIKTLEIKSGEIGEEAFYSGNGSKAKIVSLTLGENVTSIGSHAFAGNLISGELVIPDNVTTIGVSAFNSNQISKLSLGTGVTTIGLSAFKSNQISGELVIPDNVTTIGGDAFESNQITSLTIGSGVTSISMCAFRYNPTLSSILIKRTEEDFLANVTVGTNWYDTTSNPSFTYDPS